MVRVRVRVRARRLWQGGPVTWAATWWVRVRVRVRIKVRVRVKARVKVRVRVGVKGSETVTGGASHLGGDMVGPCVDMC